MECRLAKIYNVSFTFDAPVNSGEVTVIAGTATGGALTFTGNTLTAQLTDVTPDEVVTLHVANVNRDGPDHGDIPFGFLVGDSNGDRAVTRSDVALVKDQLRQPTTSANFREDINANGHISKLDLAAMKRNRGHVIP